MACWFFNKQKMMTKKWLRIFSPCIIGAISLSAFIVWAWLKRNETQGWSMLAAYAFLPLLLVLLVVDVFAKLFFKSNNLYLWITEIILMIIAGSVFAAAGSSV